MPKSKLIFGNGDVMSADLRHALHSALSAALDKQSEVWRMVQASKAAYKAYQALPFFTRVKMNFKNKRWCFLEGEVLKNRIYSAQWEESAINAEVDFLKSTYTSMVLLVPDGFHLTLDDANRIAKWLDTTDE